MQRIKQWIAIGLFAGLFSACASNGSTGGAAFNQIVNQRTPLYFNGPMQGTPPDTYLEAGTRIRILNLAGNHVRVETLNGQIGFIPGSSVESQGNL